MARRARGRRQRLATRAGLSVLVAMTALLIAGCGQSTPQLARPHVRVTIPATTSTTTTTTTTTTTLPPAPITTTVAPAPVVDPPPAPQPITTHGPHSYAWWEAIATCESGNTDAPRTGYYGLEADHPVGGMSKADQLAWAEQIDAASGDGAWGCSPVAWQNVPSG